MAERIESPQVAVAAGTLSTAPVSTALTWTPGHVRRVQVLVPPGPSGRVGFRIGHSGQSIVPRTVGQWIVADNETLDWDLEGYPVGNKWFVQAYNEGIYTHTLYFRFHLLEITPAPSGQVAIIPIVQTVPVFQDES